MKKIVRFLTLMHIVSGIAFCSNAETISISGASVSFENASVSTVGDDTILTFTENGSLSIPKTAKVRMLIVGGGGAGGTVGTQLTRGAAGGGGAGGVSDRTIMLEPGEYHIKVGEGGKKSQTSVQSWVGDDGEASAISYEDETGYIASAKGGGGGGSVKIGGEGTPGASGGGGSWYGEFMRGGDGTEGYGWSGGTPVDEYFGGGGGGASLIGTLGTGGNHGAAGAGRTNDITGVVVEYSVGGRGGRRGDDSYVPHDGVGFGSGGDGAVNGIGGSGANGVVIIRFSKLFDYKYVNFPTAPVFTNRFVWVNGAQYTALDLDEADDYFRNAIDHIEGVTNTTCSITDGGTVTNGLGRFDFAIYLNEEYKWNDGTEDGSTFPYSCSWKVIEPDVIGDITVEIKKTVDWFEGTNATIAIDVHSTPEMRIKTPSVLMLGSMCYKHGLTPEIVKTALDTLANVGNVDYYFFLQVSSTNDPDLDNPAYSGHLNVGEKAVNVPTEDYSNMHGALYAFYEYLWRAMNSDTEYDYIVLSFDRSKVATTYPAQHPHEAEVSQYIKGFYDRNAVIWMVDNVPPDCDDLTFSYRYRNIWNQWTSTETTVSVGLQQTPWIPSVLVGASVSGGGDSWTTFQGYYDKGDAWHVSGETAKANYKGLMGIFDPSKYSSANSDYDTNNPNISATANSGNQTNWKNNVADLKNQINNLSGKANPNQVVYNDADEVARVLEDVVKPTIATMKLEDHVYLKNGLKINSTEGYWTTNENQKEDSWYVATQEWTKLKPTELTDSNEDGVRIQLENIETDVWLKLKVGVSDTGRFLSSVNATYNERTGLWEKDPNDGPVTVRMTPKDGDDVLAKDQAKTTVEWSFEAFKITGGVVWGEGEFIINGFFTNLISVAKGYNPEVLFRGAPGWAINYINVDGVVLDEVHYKTNWYFGAISADHDIRVGFTNIVVNPPPPEIGPVTTVYDGTGYSPITTVQPTFAEGYEEYSNMWYMVYSTDPDADPNDRDAWSRDGVITNVVLDADGNPAPQTVYARVCLEQPGYENGCVVDYWIGTNTVTIIPAEIEITFEDYVQDAKHGVKTDDFTWHQTGGPILQDGEEIIVNSTVLNRPTTKDADPGIITDDENGDLYVYTPGSENANYIIHVVDGKYYYPDVQLVAEAENIEKVYDGIQTGITVNVKFPVDAKTYTSTSSKTSNGSYTYSSRSSRTRVINGYVSNASSGGTKYYNCVSNWVDTTVTTVTCTLTEEYSTDGGNTWTTVNPQFTNVGEYEVLYRVNYTSNVTETVTREAWLTGNSSSRWDATSEISNSRHTQTFPPKTVSSVTYSEYSDVATVKINPRPVVITAGSAEKIYDGTPLTQNGYSVSETTETTGFVSGEGISSATMTQGSSITLPGSTDNSINSVVVIPGTDLNNYNIKYVDGSLVVTPNKLSAKSTSENSKYNGTPNESFSVTDIKDNSGRTLDPSEYTIKYKTNPWDDYTLDTPPVYTNAGEYVVYYIVDAGDGYEPVEGYEIYTISPRTVTISADGAVKWYDGDPLSTNSFFIVENEKDDGFAPGEGIEALTMTDSSVIVDPGTEKNSIDSNDTANWTFVGGLDDETFRQNYVVKYLTSNLVVKVQARALWITDHKDPGEGWVYLAFEPELLDPSEDEGWITRFAKTGKIKVKYGHTTAEVEECEPIPVELSDYDGHIQSSSKVWIKVPLTDKDGNNIVNPRGLWRIVLAGASMQLSGTEGYIECKPEERAILGTNGAVSVNTFGIYRADRTTTNSMVTTPWTWYSKIQKDAEDIPVKKLIKPTNLVPGDLIYAPVDNDTYAMWEITEREALRDGKPFTDIVWSPIQIIRTNGDGYGRLKFIKNNDDDEEVYKESMRIARSHGVWLMRKHPIDDELDPIPFYVYGQYVTNEVITICKTFDTNINETVHSTMIGNPYWDDIVLTDLNYSEIPDKMDRIKVHNDIGVNKDLLWDNGKGWRELISIILDGRKRNAYTYKTVIPSGMAFWYDRRGSKDMIIKWEKPSWK